ncbi:hypothetical protein [Luteimonas lutimaris]|uniref:Uncharacterized protein n=1 Tax=Luteimonas lutimaris TaxID=698645 RepID=A0ABP7MXS3_9GAMM|nr:hypothetical protein [Luteimonas sp.]
MKQDPDRRGYAFAIGGGVLLWLAAMAVGGRREAWDAGVYWVAAYPLAIVLAGWLGYEFPRRAWRWGLAIMLAQAMTLAVTALDFSLLPLGLIVFAVLSLPLMAAAVLVARWTRRSQAD